MASLIRSVLLVTAFASAPLVDLAQTALPQGEGRGVLERMCTTCHQTDVITGQRLTAQRWREKVDQMVSYGAQGSESDIKVLVRYLAQNFGRDPATPGSTQSPLASTSTPSVSTSSFGLDELSITSRFDASGTKGVTPDRILQADKEPQNWLTFHGTYRSNHFSSLNEVTRGNIHRLGLQWVFQSRSLDAYEATPIVVDGVLYTMEGDNVVALDATNGRLFWMFRYTAAPDVRLCCGRVNRGVGVLGNMVFVAEADNHLVALDARTGRPIWNTTVANTSAGYSLTGAPFTAKDKVIVGVSGGEYGVRGFIVAYDAQTGAERWRFYTTAGPGDPGNDTWGRDSWKHGGGTAWLTGSYDPETDLLYWGTGNPGPDMNGDVRPGDNLYTCSMIALHLESGKLAWYYQANPHNEFDWDAVQVPILADMNWRGNPRKLLLWADRNGFFYLLDRTTGQFLLAKAFVKQNWNAGFDRSGRPIMSVQSTSSAEGTLIFPDLQGGTNWFSPSFSVRTGLFYVNARDNQSYLYIKAKQTFEEGAEYKSEGHLAKRPAPPAVGTNQDQYTAVRALDPTTGQAKWEFKLDAGPDLSTFHDYKADHGAAGILTTASDLLFTGGRQGTFVALDARNGELLWKQQLGGSLLMNPMTYAVHGKQYIAVAAGTSLFVFGLQ
jgi:alcohol dehydrogenase (cytochrome c)